MNQKDKLENIIHYQKIEIINLWEILQEEWSKLDENMYKNLVDSMPRRINAVIANKGNPTKY